MTLTVAPVNENLLIEPVGIEIAFVDGAHLKVSLR
jgi:hypothetical protein